MLTKFYAAVVAVAFAAVSTAALAITADELIAKNVAARGGLAQIRAITSLRRTGHLILPGANLDVAVRRTLQRGGKIRDEYTLQGLTQVNAYDGTEAWKIDPFEGRKDPARMSVDEAKSLILEGDLDLPLVDYAAKGYNAEYLGTEDVDGTPTYKLRLRRKSGDQVVYFIDPDSYMIIRNVQKQIVRGAEQETETDYGEYEKVAGVYFPSTEQSGPKDTDASQKQEIVFDTAAANEAPAANYFSFPSGH